LKANTTSTFHEKRKSTDELDSFVSQVCSGGDHRCRKCWHQLGSNSSFSGDRVTVPSDKSFEEVTGAAKSLVAKNG
jgi:hypothetical protein